VVEGELAGSGTETNAFVGFFAISILTIKREMDETRPRESIRYRIIIWPEAWRTEMYSTSSAA
jgi:hypothetical protein